MRVPGRARAGLEGDHRAHEALRFIGAHLPVDGRLASEVGGGTFDERPRAGAHDRELGFVRVRGDGRGREAQS